MDQFPLRLASFVFIALKDLVKVELDPNLRAFGVGLSPKGDFSFRFFGVTNGP